MGSSVIDARAWIVFAGAALLALGWWWQRQDRMRLALFALVLAGGLLRLAPSLDEALHPWDERYHALVSKNLIGDPLVPMLYADPDLPHDDTDWTRSHIWLNKPPLSLWCIALSIKSFGLHAWAIRIPSILFACLAIGLCYALALLFSSARVAFWCAFLFAVNGHLIELASGRTSTDHPDAVLVVMVLAACYAAVRMARDRSTTWAWVCGACMGLALLAKAWPALLVVPVALTSIFAFSHERPKRVIFLVAIVVLAAALLAAPWQLHVRSSFPGSATIIDHNQFDHFGNAVGEHARPWYYYLVQFPMMHGELAPLAVAWALLLHWRARSRRALVLWAWSAIPFVIFSFALSKMPAYTAIAAPAVFLLIAIVIVDWAERPTAHRLVRYAYRLGAALLVALPLVTAWNRIRPFESSTPPAPIPAHIAHALPRTVVVGCPDPISVMFRTSVAAAYAEPLHPDEMERIKALGYLVVEYGSDANTP